MTAAQLKFGDAFTNPWASERNPTRVGYFVRRGVRTGNLNRGPYCEFTDRKGKFWTMATSTVDEALAAQPIPDKRGGGVKWI